MKEKSTFSSVLSLIIYIAITVLWFIGVPHAFKKHGTVDGFLSLLPPWGAYRGIESYSHKKSKTESLKYDKNKDAIIVLQFITAMPENDEEERKLNDVVKKYAIAIQDFQESERIYLKDAAKMYVRFHSALSEDMTETVTGLIQNANQFDLTKWDQRSKPIMDSLISIYGISEIMPEYERLNRDLITIRSGMLEKGVTSDEKDVLLSNLSIGTEKDKLRIGTIYKTIFNEVLPYTGY